LRVRLSLPKRRSSDLLELPRPVEHVKDLERSISPHAAAAILVHHEKLRDRIVGYLFNFSEGVDHHKSRQLPIDLNEKGMAPFLCPVIVQVIITIQTQIVDISLVVLGKLIIILLQQIAEDLFLIYINGNKLNVHALPPRFWRSKLIRLFTSWSASFHIYCAAHSR